MKTDLPTSRPAPSPARGVARPPRAAWALATALVALAILAGAARPAPAAAQAPAPAGTPSSAPTSPGASTTVPSATPPVAGNPQNNTFSVSPTGPEASQPGSRAAFAFELAPGTSADDSATVWNYGDQPRQFNIYARDAFNNESGLIDLLTKDKQNADLGGWIALSTQQVTVPAHSGVTVPFSVTAPRTASPGDHDAGIVVSAVNTNAQTNPNKVQVENRVGTRVYLRVTGPLDPALVIDDIQSTYRGSANPAGGELDVTYTVHNAGNIRLRGHQSVSISGVLGIGAQQRDPGDLAEMLPGTSAVRTERFTGVPAGVRITSEVTVTPFAPKASGQSDASAQPASASTATWAIPWALLVLLALLVVGLVLWRRSRRRGRGRPAPPAAPSPETVGAGAAGGPA